MEEDNKPPVAISLIIIMEADKNFKGFIGRLAVVGFSSRSFQVRHG